LFPQTGGSQPALLEEIAEVPSPENHMASQAVPSEGRVDNRKGRFLENAMDVQTFAKAVRGWPQAALAELIVALVQILREKQKHTDLKK
jgi:hypothetical protein